MHQNLSCSSELLSLDVGGELFASLPVIFFDNSYPLLNPSSKDFFKVKVPLADPFVVSF